MDGFNPTDRVIVIGATNIPEALDPAITRPGRFDKIIHLTAPDLKGRIDILDYYIKKIKHDPKLSVEDIARRTSQFTGADLKNIVNQAILMAVKRDKDQADIHDFDEAYDDIVMGVTRRGLKGNDEEIKATAYHEGTLILLQSVMHLWLCLIKTRCLCIK